MIRLFKVAMSPTAGSAVANILESGYIGQGSMVEEFERQLKNELGGEVLTTNSCTSALDLALHLVGVGPGDEVITTAMACTASSGVIVNRKAQIVWADVNPLTGCIDPADVARKLTKRTKAIIAVDWGGRVCDYATLRTIGPPVIEDAAHSYLATRGNGLRLPTSGGDLICWSFQAIKHLTTGDGGALFIRNEAERERARLLRWYGLDRRGGDSFRCAQTIHEAGYKYHMNDIAAAIGCANIGLARENVRKHRANALFYRIAFDGFAGITTPPWDGESSWWLYTILVNDRDGFIARMRECCGVECSPVHARNDKHPAFRGYGAPLPGLDHFAECEVAIPVGWWLTENDRQCVVEAVKACAK